MKTYYKVRQNFIKEFLIEFTHTEIRDPEAITRDLADRWSYQDLSHGHIDQVIGEYPQEIAEACVVVK